MGRQMRVSRRKAAHGEGASSGSKNGEYLRGDLHTLCGLERFVVQI